MGLSISPNVSAVDNKSGSLTATDILNTVKTVDGSGSGLDADTVDGYNIGTSGATIPLNNGTNTWSNNQIFSGTSGGALVTITNSGAGVGLAVDDLSVTSTSVVTNLNADLLDGYHVGTSGSTIPRLDTANTWSGTQYFTETRWVNSYTQHFTQSYSPSSYLTTGEFQEILTVTPTGSSQNYEIHSTIYIQTGSTIQILNVYLGLRSDTLPDLSWSAEYDERLIGNVAFVKPVLWTKETTTAAFKLALEHLTGTIHNITAHVTVVNRGGYSNTVMNTAVTSDTTTVPAGYTSNNITKILNIDTTNFTYKGNTIWCGGNDGTGSGLDADLLDGQHGSYYQDAGNLNTGTIPSARLPASTGDVTSPVGSSVFTLSASGVSAGTYNNSSTAITPYTVDSKGRITATGSAVTITPAWSSVSGKPTTLSGYGITDALSLTGGSLSGTLSFTNGTSTKLSFDDTSAYWLVTASNWGMYWDTTANRISWRGAGTERAYLDLDDGTAGFNGTITAPTFSGNLSGNASSVTNGVYTTGDQTIAGVKTFSSQLVASNIRTDVITNINGNQLVVNVGESGNYATGQTGENLYVNAEGGLEISSSPDNWTTGWVNRVTTLINSSGITHAGNTVWHGGNDGSGSGLDADTVDGVQAQTIVSGNGSTSASNGGPGVSWSGTHISQYKSGFWDQSGASWTPDTGWWWGVTLAHTSNSSSYLYGGQMVIQNATNPKMYIRTVSGGGSPSAGAWKQVWHDGSDGSGSGLDADLLDGSHRDTAYNSFGNGTIPVRHSAGYLYSNYFNCTANATTTTPTHVAIQTSSDNFIRWQTTAQFKTNFGITALENTGLGLIGAVGLDTTTNTASEWAALPVGYARMFGTAVQRGGSGLEGAPESEYGYFMKIANRDGGSPNGWAGIWVGHNTNNFYYGRSSDGSTTATWNKVQNELISGTNIKTINGSSVLGSGDLTVTPAVIRTYTEVTPTASQTVFAISYTVGLIDVYVNGVKLHNADFTATNGTSVTLIGITLTTTDVVGFNVWGTFNIANTVTLTGTETLSNKTLTGVKETAVTMGAGTAIDLNAGNLFSKTISGNTTFTISNTPTSGTMASFILDLTNGGSATITWWSNVKWQSGVAPTLTASGRDAIGFFTYDAGATWTALLLAKDIK